MGRSSNQFLPIFRDKDELASSANLSDTLLQALAASRNLIVICSPAAAKSRWVNEEVGAFLALGRGQRVFCVVVEGEPNDPPSCFPENLRTTEPLAIDLRTGGDGRDAVRLRLAASLLGIGFDKLRQRDAQRRRRLLLQQTIAGCAAVAIAAGLSYRFATAPPCQDSAHALDQLWNPTVQNELRQAFLSTGMPYAEDGARQVIERLNHYRLAWTQMHTDACEATLVREEQSPALIPLARAHTIRNRPDIAAGSLAWTRWLYGRALWESGEDRPLGLSYVEYAQRVFQDMGESAKSELADVEAWLEQHGPAHSSGAGGQD